MYLKQQLTHFLLQVTPKAVYKVLHTNTNVSTVYVDSRFLYESIFFFLKNSLLKYNYFIDLSCVDLVNATFRFQMTYILVSISTNQRIVFKVYLKDGAKIASICSLYKGANWYEREVWDMFGIQFSNHPDLRRLLTDYFFSGFPLRKDFPLSGYMELRYQENLKKIKYQPLKLIQEFRLFDTVSPWKQVHLFSNKTLYSPYKNYKVLHLDTILPPNYK